MKTGLKKNIVTISIASFSSKFLSFLLVPLYTTYLSTQEYGIIDIIFTATSLLLPVFSLIIFESMLRFALDNDTDKQSVFTNGLIVNLIGILIFSIASFPIVVLLSIQDFYVYFVLYFISVIIYDNLSYFSRGINKVGNYAIAGVINTVIIIALNIFFLVIFKLGIHGYLISYIVASMISSLYLLISNKLYNYLNIRKYNKKLLVKMFKYSLPLVPNSMAWWVNSSLDKFIILFFYGQAITGIYAIAYKIPSLITLIINVFNSAWILSSINNFGTSESKKYYENIFNKYFSLLILITSGIIFSSKILASLLYKEDFYEAWVFVPLLSISVFYHGLATFFGSIFTATKNTKHLFYSTLIGAIVNLVLNIIFIPIYGVIAAAFTTALSYLLIFLYRFFIGKKNYNFHTKNISIIAQNLFLFILTIIVILDYENTIFFSAIIFIIIMCQNQRFIVNMIKESFLIITRRIKKQ